MSQLNLVARTYSQFVVNMIDTIKARSKQLIDMHFPNALPNAMKTMLTFVNIKYVQMIADEHR
ncbi:LOW QUALITY PROTEIN: hypothetical protein MAR_007377 [Mya arenaria]|uniref:Uncharacterized protein n=1 Tax=Mya arenaria TaxID=6604 RepID=A0ABY7DB50_MYAAR|nr:LOW QUALITY PROTEIN: hypothetical protein MAR_007377 [Mya arenaria]